MRKILSRVLSSLFYDKVTRYRVRGFIEYGPFRALQLYKKVQQNTHTPKYKLSMCAIAKNEGRYFPEWIEYHCLMGVEKFYIYDNESEDNTKQILEPYIRNGIVEYTFFPGPRMQVAAYSHCLEKNRFDSEWMAFIDMDEFIVPLKNKNIPEFLQGYSDFSAVQINWVCYGSSGQQKHQPGLVIERFRDHAPYNHPLHCHIKTIVQPTRVIGFSGAHECVRLFGHTVDVHKNIVNKNFNDLKPVGQNIIHINHYAVKSYEEFREKSDRGRARPGKKRNDTYFNKYDLNQVKDDPQMDIYIPLVKKELKEKGFY